MIARNYNSEEGLSALTNTIENAKDRILSIQKTKFARLKTFLPIYRKKAQALFNLLKRLFEKADTTMKQKFIAGVKIPMLMSNVSYRLFPAEIDRIVGKYINPKKFDIGAINE